MRSETTGESWLDLQTTVLKQRQKEDSVRETLLRCIHLPECIGFVFAALRVSGRLLDPLHLKKIKVGVSFIPAAFHHLPQPKGQRSDKPIQLRSGAPWEPLRLAPDFTATATLTDTLSPSSSCAAAGFFVAAPHSARRRHSSQHSATRKLNRDFLVRT